MKVAFLLGSVHLRLSQPVAPLKRTPMLLEEVALASHLKLDGPNGKGELPLLRRPAAKIEGHLTLYVHQRTKPRRSLMADKKRDRLDDRWVKFQW